MADITARSLQLFLNYAADADNWSGSPIVDRDVATWSEVSSDLTQLEGAGMIEICRFNREDYVLFTDKGKALAAEHGIELD